MVGEKDRGGSAVGEGGGREWVVGEEKEEGVEGGSRGRIGRKDGIKRR